MTACYEANACAPREGCGCRACYREREKLISPVLLALLESRQFPSGASQIPGPAMGMLHRHLQTYAAGRISYDDMLTSLVKWLIEHNEQMFRELCTASILRPIVLNVDLNDPERASKNGD